MVSVHTKNTSNKISVNSNNRDNCLGSIQSKNQFNNNDDEILECINYNYQQIMHELFENNFFDIVNYFLKSCKKEMKWCLLKMNFFHRILKMDSDFELHRIEFLSDALWLATSASKLFEHVEKLDLLEKHIDERIDFYKDRSGVSELNMCTLIEQKANLKLFKASYIAVLKNISILFSNPYFIKLYKKISLMYPLYKNDENDDKINRDINKITTIVDKVKLLK